MRPSSAWAPRSLPTYESLQAQLQSEQRLRVSMEQSLLQSRRENVVRASDVQRTSSMNAIANQRVDAMEAETTAIREELEAMKVQQEAERAAAAAEASDLRAQLEASRAALDWLMGASREMAAQLEAAGAVPLISAPVEKSYKMTFELKHL